jgi:protein-S-isoprenylcysteine O-methyltransferase Ste14
MRRFSAALGSVVFLVIAPGLVDGLAPWWLTGWRAGRFHPLPIQLLGIALIAAGSAILLSAFAQFVIHGLGTPAPVAPPTELVVRGLYRHVRNPMYLAVLAVIVGQAGLLGRSILLGYAAGVAVAFVVFVRWYEQPTLARRFGAQYEAYLREVPGWWPRFRPADSQAGTADTPPTRT